MIGMLELEETHWTYLCILHNEEIISFTKAALQLAYFDYFHCIMLYGPVFLVKFNRN